MIFFLDHTLPFLLWMGWAVVPVSIHGKGIELGKRTPMTFEPKCLAWVLVRCLFSELEWRGQVADTDQARH